MAKHKNITPRDRRFIKAYLDPEAADGNATLAVEIATKDTKNPMTGHLAAQTGHRMLQKLSGHISEVMDAGGLSDLEILRPVLAGLSAMKVEVAKFQGSIDDEKEYIDHRTRLSSAELALKVKGRLNTSLLGDMADGAVKEEIKVTRSITNKVEDIPDKLK